VDKEVSRRHFFALFAHGAHGAKNPKKCRGPCGAPAGVRPCASKERRGWAFGSKGRGRAAWNRAWAPGLPGMGCDSSAVDGALARVYVGTSRQWAETNPRAAALQSEMGRRFPRRLRRICARNRWW